MTDKSVDEQIKDNIAKEQELANTQHDDNAETQNLSEFEQKIQKMGWNPKGSKSAEEWLYYGFEDRGRKLSDLGRAVDSLKELTAKQEQIALDKARAELREERRLAIARGDVAAVEQLDNKTQNMQQLTEVKKEVNDFIERNASWYKDTSPASLKMRKAAIDMDNHLVSFNLPPKQHYETLENYMRTEFASHFNDEEPNQQRTNAVEGGRASIVKTSSSRRTFGFDDLDDAQKSVCRRLERTKVMTQKEYIDALIKSGDLR